MAGIAKAAVDVVHKAILHLDLCIWSRLCVTFAHLFTKKPSRYGK